MKITDEFDKPKELEAPVRQEGKTPHPLVLSIDYEKYEHYLEDSNLTEAQKQEFLQALWNIIVNFVDLGFGVHPVQQIENCEQSGESAAHATVLTSDMPDCRNTNIVENFKETAKPEEIPHRVRKEQGVDT